MLKNIKHINFFTLTFALVLFTLSTNAQEVRVVDNKGTIVQVTNNTFTTLKSGTETPPLTSEITFPANPVKNDVFTLEYFSGEHHRIYIFDGTDWVQIAPTKASRVFYPPSIALIASVTGNFTINLYDEYFKQFDTPGPAIKSSSAPNAIPTYAANELYYYVTAYDATVLTINSIDDNGLMTYSVDNVPTDDNTLINVVFVVK